MFPGQRKALQKSLEKYGFVQPLVVTAQLQVINGNQKLAVAQEMGIKKIPCYVMKEDLTEEDRLMLQQILNKLHGKHDKDKDREIFDKLIKKNLLDEMAEGLGTTAAQFRKNMERAKAKSEKDTKPKCRVKKGDLWILGKHRIICGDSTDQKTVTRLFGNQKATQMVTDPPYGVSYSDKNDNLNTSEKCDRITEPILNDDLKDYYEFFTSFLDKVPLTTYNTCYIFMSGEELCNLRKAFEDCNYHYAKYLIWLKNAPVLGRQEYLYKHEFVMYGWKGKHKYYGDLGATSILEYNKPLTNKLHPTQKPTDILMRLIQDGSQEGDIVYDPFAGSGSTLMAAEQCGRLCYGIELSPEYVDVIISRWESLTKKKANKTEKEKNK